MDRIALELNNILAIIVSNTGLALELLGRDHAIASELLAIEAAAARAAGVTRQLLEIEADPDRRECSALTLDCA